MVGGGLRVELGNERRITVEAGFDASLDLGGAWENPMTLPYLLHS